MFCFFLLCLSSPHPPILPPVHLRSLGSLRRPAHLPPPPRSAPVGEPVTVLVVLENHLSVAVPLKDMQLVLTSAGSGEAGGDAGREEEVPCIAVDEEDFRSM